MTQPITPPEAATACSKMAKYHDSGADQIKLLAFFLPQFHPIPENDEWWEKGFTEWTNVTKAQPLFAGHYQPHLPTELGFYDLRLREVRHEQIALAKQYGIHGFCYHYYWFSGRRILERPVDDMLADGDSEMPFCLCWANENWTRRWDAADHQVLMEQKYLPHDDVEFIKGLLPFFEDPRYIRRDGASLLLVYRPQHLPDPGRTAEIWREYAEKAGIGRLHLCAALTHGNNDYAKFGFDSGVQFPPHSPGVRNLSREVNFYEPFDGYIIDYADIASAYLNRRYQNTDVFRTVFPAWDNTARTGKRAMIVLNGTPANYEFWLAESIRRTAADYPGEDRFVFINAWNEWAEGCHLEPDRRYHRQFLEATLRAKMIRSDLDDFSDTGLPVEQPTMERTLSGDLAQVLRYHLGSGIGRTKMFVNRIPWLRAALLPVVRETRRIRTSDKSSGS